MLFPKTVDITDVLNGLWQIGALVPPVNPLEVSPCLGGLWLDLHEQDPRPAVVVSEIRLAPVLDRCIEWWTGSPDVPYWRGEERYLSPATEALAWYCGYHNYRPDQWGIYFRERAVTALAQRPHGRMAQTGRCDPTVSEVRALFFDKVWHSRHFHHIVEAALARLELRHEIALYPSHLDTYIALRAAERFIFEEMAANARAIGKVAVRVLCRLDGHSHSARAFEGLMKWMRLQPQGYNVFDRALGPVFWIKALESLAEELLPDKPELHHEFQYALLDEVPGDGRLERAGPEGVPMFLVDRL